MKKDYILFVVIFLLNSCYGQEQNHRVPKWAMEAVWYQIFPERFNNGDKSNDPKPSDMIAAWPYKIPKGWQNHPWTSDWYKLQPWEKNQHDFYWNVQNRRYGGDLQGVIDKLDYLKDLGITAIYFNPIFEAPTLHKYDASMYRHVDNNFGPNPSADQKLWETENPIDPSTWKWTSADKLFLKLLQETHDRNIKVIIDGVFNHTGTTFWAFKDIVDHQDSSLYKDWYTINSFDDPSTTKNEFDYEGWIGVKDLPELKENNNGLIPQIEKHIHNIVMRWMDPNADGNPSDGIDGWRLDVAEMVNHNFWKKFRTWVKDINSEAYITGEIWWDDWSINKMMDASPWLEGDQFDAVMNYRFTRAAKRFISDKDSVISAQGFIDTINTLRRQYNKDNFYVLMNLLGSHDTERLGSMVKNPDVWYDHGQMPASNKNFDVSKPNEMEYKKIKLMVALQMTMPGAPMIYYGDEVGMWGGDDPDCRKPMVWKGIEYEDETTHPLGFERPTDKVEVNAELFQWYKKLIDIRHNNRELSVGELEFVNTGNDRVLAFIRSTNNSKLLTLINSSDNINSIPIDLSGFNVNLLKNNFKTIYKIGKLKLSPYSVVILK